MSEAQAAVVYRAIGVIRSPHRVPAGTPIQPRYAQDVEGEVVMREDLEPALMDLEGFERVWLLYAFDRAGSFEPRVTPYRDTQEHGLFATRAPSRPNPLGMSVVRLLGREGNVLRVRDLDVLDGTPLLDIKPYVPEFDAYPDARAGWLDQGRDDRRRADERFHDSREP